MRYSQFWLVGWGPRKSLLTNRNYVAVRPLFFISLFLVTSARSFRQELKKKKKEKSTTGVEQRSSIRPNMIVHANNNIVSKRGLPLVCFKCGSAVPVPSLSRKRFHRSSSRHILCAKNALRRGACSHSMAEADAHLTATLGD